MESPKYLIIITLIDGQNFTLPEGASTDKVETFVFAEARFGNESILKSDPIKLMNSNPEFVTELAWQLDKKSLHQMRVERKSIKLQIFMQIKEKKKPSRQTSEHSSLTNGFQSSEASSANKVELIGYTIVDIRSAQETDQPKFRWVPLLNPKFRKSVYNRPEIQIALTLNRVEDNMDSSIEPDPLSSTTYTPLTESSRIENDNDVDLLNESHETYDVDGVDDNTSKLYKTCLDFTLNQENEENEEIIENDLNIRSIDGCFYIYDTRNTEKKTVEDCNDCYRITVTIPFNSDLHPLAHDMNDSYYFTVSLFETSVKTDNFKELTCVETKEVYFTVYTTDLDVLTTYFKLNSSLIIKLHNNSGTPLGIATIQLDQLCLDTKCHSIEGIFALQSLNDNDNIPTSIHPTIGVSVVLEKVSDELNSHVQQQKFISDEHIELAKEHFGGDIDEFLSFKTLNDTHQLTLDEETNTENETNNPMDHYDNLEQDNHHFCFIIDLKNFSYTTNQRLIPTLRELVVRYSYPFFGYKDPITTDASTPISSTKSIIVNGYCEFNFATTVESLYAALKEIPLELDILTCDHINLNVPERVIATSNLNLAHTLAINEENILKLKANSMSAAVSAPIHGLDGDEIGELEISLCLKDLGVPNYNFKTSIESLNERTNSELPEAKSSKNSNSIDSKKLDDFIAEARSSFETWKEDFVVKFTEEVRKRENERFRRLYQRLEAREAKKELEFKKKTEELSSLEKRLKNSFAYLESLERRLSNNFEQLRSKDDLLDARLNTFDLKVSKAINDVKLDYDRKIDSLPARLRHSQEDNTFGTTKQMVKNSARTISDAPSIRRSSLRNPSNVPTLALPMRSSSLVRPNEGLSSCRFVKRPTNVITTVVNGTCSTRPRSNSTRLNISKETQEKLISLRKEKAELLKRGCRPNDELIQEINSMIEKLACC